MCVITDHALLRYIERVWGVDVAKARAEIMASERIVNEAARFGCGTVKLGIGAKLKLVGDTIVTVIPKRGR